MKNIKKFLEYCDNWILDDFDIKTIKSAFNRYVEDNLNIKDYKLRLIFQNNIETKKDYIDFLNECNEVINDNNDKTILLDLLLSKPTYSKFNSIVDKYDFNNQIGGQLAYACKSNISLRECYNIILKEYNCIDNCIDCSNMSIDQINELINK